MGMKKKEKVSATNSLHKIIVALIACLFFVGAARAANVYTVNSTGDAPDANAGNGVCDDGAGNCTLRAAIEEANATAGTDAINFNITGAAGVRTISPASPLPDINEAVTIDGYTQPGASANTLSTSDNAVILIEISGANAGANANGLRIVGSGSTISGLAINRFSRDGISLNGGDGNTISGNFIGTDATGMIDFGNGSIGIEGEFGSNPNSNLIGGTTPAARNIISGNNGEAGIEFNFAGNNVIQGNFIGLAADGTTALGNTGFGVGAGAFTGGTIIGGDDAADGTVDGNIGARNYISGNGGAGVFFGGAAFGGCIIAGNYIGTDATGTLARGNGIGIGSNVGVKSIIGGTTSGAGNLISGNTGDGISAGFTSNLIVRRNFIGTKADGTTALGNGGDGIDINAGGGGDQIGGTNAGGEGNIIAFNAEDGVQIDDVGVTPANHSILGNSIYSNGGLGINLSIDGVTPNDAGDADTGANNRQNYPVINAAVPAGSGSTRVVGTFNSNAGRTFRLEFFDSPAIDASGSGEGRFYVGAIQVTTDASGNAAFDNIFAYAAPVNSYVSSTATDLTTGDTSEFSNARLVVTTTAASVSIGGRVSDASGRGLSGARVALTDASGSVRYATTNPFGYYRFAEVAAGETYVLTATHKRCEFSAQAVSVNEERDDINFVGNANF
jgi:CSLREA domain-containing protein